MAYSITYHKVNGSIPCYHIKVQDTYTYQYLRDFEVFDDDYYNIDETINKLKEEFPDSYTCEIFY